MSLLLYALINDSCRMSSLADLRHELEKKFTHDARLHFRLDVNPFGTDEHLVLDWSNWAMSVFWDEGVEVLSDSEYIANTTGASSAEGRSRRIRVAFDCDPSGKFTNEAIYMVEWLQSIRDVIVFDPNSEEILELE